MLVLSRKKQQSVVVECTEGFERLLKVTVLEIRGGEVKLGFDIEDEVPISGQVPQEASSGSGSSSSPQSPSAVRKEESNRWADDGGHSKPNAETIVPGVNGAAEAR